MHSRGNTGHIKQLPAETFRTALMTPRIYQHFRYELRQF
jgi:hypothetical protein